MGNAYNCLLPSRSVRKFRTIREGALPAPGKCSRTKYRRREQQPVSELRAVAARVERLSAADFLKLECPSAAQFVGATNQPQESIRGALRLHPQSFRRQVPAGTAHVPAPVLSTKAVVRISIRRT